ncbi:hypothetical protein GCM10010270_86220 [Streptomyces violaceus]|nr:hypothetical protein GCM10010270_86220 [Streptomyces janthinus]
MDPAVTAAVIAVPTALFAAVAAYAGARSQARSAHRGPVDAVRRQHQRDAYAAFLTALQAYETATKWETCFGRAHEALLASLPPGTHPAPHLMSGVSDHARELVRTTSVEELMRTGAVVNLEGPDGIAAAAMITTGCARRVRATAGSPEPPRIGQPDPLLEAHQQLGAAISEFVRVARAHLNGTDG